MDIRQYNRDAWNRQVEDGNPWTIPVSTLAAGFVLTGFYEDRYPQASQDLLGRYTATFIATRAHKTGTK